MKQWTEAAPRDETDDIKNYTDPIPVRPSTYAYLPPPFLTYSLTFTLTLLVCLADPVTITCSFFSLKIQSVLSLSFVQHPPPSLRLLPHPPQRDILDPSAPDHGKFSSLPPFPILSETTLKEIKETHQEAPKDSTRRCQRRLTIPPFWFSCTAGGPEDFIPDRLGGCPEGFCLSDHSGLVDWPKIDWGKTVPRWQCEFDFAVMVKARTVWRGAKCFSSL